MTLSDRNFLPATPYMLTLNTQPPHTSLRGIGSEAFAFHKFFHQISQLLNSQLKNDIITKLYFEL